MFSADIAAFIQDKDGTYTGLITRGGHIIQIKDSSGNIVPLNKESVEKFMGWDNK